ncbi:hypothetical protein [Kitasatospora sp. NPDC058218]|uniref:hypothetical protein n=1 Tax=Kitasatospora sp. NPDC058218 TaxID=3346385 RepID=UPI0036DD60A6
MIIIIGLVILVAAVVVGVAGVLTNTGSGHALTGGFEVFGYHVTGSTGTLFLYGIIVGALAMFGLSLLLGGARRTSRRGRAARHGLKESRRETAAADRERDELIGQRDTARAETAAAGRERDDLVGQRDAARAEPADASGNGAPREGLPPDPDDGHRNWSHPFGHRSDPGGAETPPREDR